MTINEAVAIRSLHLLRQKSSLTMSCLSVTILNWIKKASLLHSLLGYEKVPHF